MNTSPLDSLVTEDDVERLFLILLKRSTGNIKFRQDVAASGISIADFIKTIRSSPELHRTIALLVGEQGSPGSQGPSSGYKYRAPVTFTKSTIPARKILLVGSCLLAAFTDTLRQAAPDCEYDTYLNTGALPEVPLSPIEGYLFQVVQIALRSVLPDMSFAKLRYSDISSHQNLFEHCCISLEQQVTSSLRWNQELGLLTFVINFPVPQQNLVGRLLPRYDLRNPVYFIEKLNEHLAKIVSKYRNAYFFDINEVSATFARRYSSEDNVAAFNHGSFINDFNFSHDQGRLESPAKASAIYDTNVPVVMTAMWHEMFAMYRSVAQIDSIKMVVIDLDDTLWRGVVADSDLNNFPTQEGWPQAFWEALLILKKRGIILAVISKNEEQVVRDAWNRIIGRALSLDDFAIAQINWSSKATNMRIILDTVNLASKNVLYIDDNPLQLAEIKDSFPDMRVLGGQPFQWRHYLLTSPELQSPIISNESIQRNEMIQGQVQREAVRATLSSGDFLKSLNITMSMFDIQDVGHPRFGRALELINKTNQFNTTGRRWRMEEVLQAFQRGTIFYAFELTDKFTEYGLVGVLIVDDRGIIQFVMSCRIMGLDAEIAAVNHIALLRSSKERTLFAEVIPTEQNLPCRNIYSRCGFAETSNGWQLDLERSIEIPSHIALTDSTTPYATDSNSAVS